MAHQQIYDGLRLRVNFTGSDVIHEGGSVLSSTSPNPVPGDPQTEVFSVAPPAKPPYRPAADPRQRVRAPGEARTWKFGDAAKDVGAILAYGFGLGTMFFAGRHIVRPVHEESPVMVLATVSVVAVVASSVMRATGVGTAAVALLIRWIPAALLSLVVFAYLIGLYLPFTGNETSPGLGIGFVVMLSLAILTGAPRTAEDNGRNRFIWGCFALTVLVVLTIANITAAFQGSRTAEASFAAIVTAVVMAILLWLPIPAGRSTAVFAAAGLLILYIVIPGEPEASLIGGGDYVASLGFGTMLLITGLMAAGFLQPREPGRRFADGVAWLVILAAICALSAVGALASAQFGIGTQVFLLMAGVGGAAHLVLGHSDRRARSLPALAIPAALLLFGVIYRVSVPGGGFGIGFHVPLILAVLALVALARADRDPYFAILTPAVTAHTSDPEQLARLEADAYRQSAGVFAALSVLSGPLGMLFGVLAFGRASRAESAGLQTTAIRMVAGTGIVLAIASTTYLWLVVGMMSSGF